MYMPVLRYFVCCFTMDTEIFHYRGSHGYLRDNSSAVSRFLYKPWIEGNCTDQIENNCIKVLHVNEQTCMNLTRLIL